MKNIQRAQYFEIYCVEGGREALIEAKTLVRFCIAQRNSNNFPLKILQKKFMVSKCAASSVSICCISASLC